MWNNDYPSSISLCRPKILIFAKETPEVVSKMNAEIQALVPTEIGNVSVETKMCFTMVDTKVVNDITKTHSCKCYICLRSGKKLNLPLSVADTDDPERYKYGLSPLHANIRSMDMFIKISSRLTMEVPDWKVPKANFQVKEREETICTTLKEQLGLHINEPRPGGGNSNSGNVARRFFEKRDAVAEITGLDKGLLERFYVILTIINSKAQIDVRAYQAYAEETRVLYNKLYGWYALSPTVHKLLLHGAAIIKHALLPIGMFSEEAGECRNKSIRKIRDGHARKFSREINLEDVFKRLLLTSDPLISLTNRRPSGCSDFPIPEITEQLIL